MNFSARGIGISSHEQPYTGKKSNFIHDDWTTTRQLVRVYKCHERRYCLSFDRSAKLEGS